MSCRFAQLYHLWCSVTLSRLQRVSGSVRKPEIGGFMRLFYYCLREVLWSRFRTMPNNPMVEEAFGDLERKLNSITHSRPRQRCLCWKVRIRSILELRNSVALYIVRVYCYTQLQEKSMATFRSYNSKINRTITFLQNTSLIDIHFCCTILKAVPAFFS